MSATVVDAAFAAAAAPPPQWGRLTADLDPTTDLRDESTSDLPPGTVDLDEPPGAVTQPIASSASPATAATARRTALQPGTVLNDRYLVEELIGAGGVAQIYRARDMYSSDGAAFNAQVAVKTPRAELHDAERARRRLSHEYSNTAALSHPNIVRALDLYTDSEPYFMTMELIDGRPLSMLLREANGPLPTALALQILQGCASALAHAHKHDVVHGDFKPENIFVTRDQGVKVIDFGAAAAPGTAPLRIAAGTPAYASPEILSGETPEPRDDVFSFACVAYEVLTGARPFDGRSSLQAREEGRLPPRAWSLSSAQWLTLLSALSWSREQRPSDVEALVKTLTQPAEETLQPTLTPAAAAESHAAEVDGQSAPAPDLPEDLLPPQRSWGFFVFVACALAVIFVASRRHGELGAADAAPDAAMSAQPQHQAPATDGLMAVVATRSGAIAPVQHASADAGATQNAAPQATSGSSAQSRAKPAAQPRSAISFASNDIVTSEGSVAAVFLIKRSQPLSGRARVRWRAESGSADAGVDFTSTADGVVEFADGQAQRAIYVPLRNDLLKEDDETFTVRLHSPQAARLGSTQQATATIRDDDS